MTAAVHWHSSEQMPEVPDASAKLLVGASVHLKGAPWDAYARLYHNVYNVEGKRIIRPDGFFVVIQTDAYADGEVTPRNVLLPQTILAMGWRLVDVKVWERRAADFFQVPFSQVFVFAPPGSKHSRSALQKHKDFFQGIWRFPQAKGGELAAYPPGLCALLIEAFTAPGDLIVDPFAGTAALLGAAARAGRRAIGFEINEDLRPIVVANLGEPAQTTLAVAVPKPAEDSPADPAPTTEVTATPAWSRGYDVSDLRAVADLFRAHDAGFTQGAFTPVKEATIADWRAAGLLHTAMVDGALVGAACIERAAAARTIRDFAGADIGGVAPGDVVIKRIAGTAESLIAAASAGSSRTWLEIWQERAADRALAARLGFTWAGSKIRASSEIVGVWARGVPVAPPAAAEAAALVRLDLPPLDSAPLAAQLAAAQWADHYSGYNKRHSWTACVLRGYGGRADFIIKPAEMSKKWKSEHADEIWWSLADTPLRAALPAAEPLIAAIPGAKHRIRLMRLRAGDGELSRHADITDPDAGVALGRLLRIHIPIVTNPDVKFRQWLLDGSEREAHMAFGEAWYLDTRKPHTALNRGHSDRIHLVMDVVSNPALLDLLGCTAPPAARSDQAQQEMFT